MHNRKGDEVRKAIPCAADCLVSGAVQSSALLSWPMVGRTGARRVMTELTLAKIRQDRSMTSPSNRVNQVTLRLTLIGSRIHGQAASQTAHFHVMQM